MIYRHVGLRFELVYTENGYWCNIFDDDGKTLGITEIFWLADEARLAAEDLIDSGRCVRQQHQRGPALESRSPSANSARRGSSCANLGKRSAGDCPPR